jgi:sulfite reductase beta subunit-like hemoprotein
LQACGDDPRNVVGCPVAGVDPGELADARHLVQQVNRLYQGNRAFSNLPRKFKVSISGCCLRCAQPEINDIGVNAVWRDRLRGDRVGGRELGYDIVVGGGLSTTPRIAKRLPAFLLPEQVTPVCGAIADLFREHGNRDKRTQARMKFLVDEWGVERFFDELQARLPFTLDQDVPPLPELPRERDHMGVHAQRQPGFYYVGLASRLGRLTGEQMRVVAHLARTYGDGNIRFTNNQNVVVTGVAEAHVPELVRQAANALLPTDADVWQRNFVACTGAQFCNLAVTDTKLDPGQPSPAEEALTTLQQRLGHFKHFVRINYNGCPNSCGQHWVADVGLQGVLMKGPNREEIQGALVTVGGGLGQQSGFGRNTGIRLPLTDVPDALVRLFTAFEHHAETDEDFHGFVTRTSDEALRGWLTGAVEPVAVG